MHIIASLNFHPRNYRALLQNIKKSNGFLNHVGGSEQGYITMVNAYHSCELWTKSVRTVARGAAVLFPAFSLLMLSIAGVALPSTPALAMTINCTGAPATVTHPALARVFVDVSAGTCAINGPIAGPGLGDVEVRIQPDLGLGRVIGARYLAGGSSLFSRFQMCDFGDGAGDKGTGGCNSANPPLNTNLTGIFEWDSTSTNAPFFTDRRLTMNYSVAANGGTITSAQLTILTPEINVTGNGQSIASGDVTPDAADHTSFGAAAVTGGTVARTFTIENSGDGDLELGSTAVSLAGAHAGDFSVTAQPPIVVGPADTRTFTITFDPSAVGNREATVSIANNDADEAPYTFAISGSGVTSTPEINVTGNGTNIMTGDVTPDSSDHTLFSGDVGLGPFTRTFTINNTGTGDLTLGANAVSVTGASAFAISAQPATSVTSGNSTTFDVTFTPLVVGVQTATVSIANNDTDEAPFTFNISGDPRGPLGGTLAANGFNSITNNDLTPDTADATDFGNQDLAAGAASRTYILSVNGFGASIFGANAVTLTGSSAFSVTQQLPLQGPNPGGLAFAQTSFQIAFDPSANGLQTATVTLNSNIPGMNPMIFAVQGTGTGGTTPTPEIEVRGNSVDIVSGDTTPALTDHTNFDSVDVAGATQDRTFTIANTGSATLTLGANAVSLAGANAADFIVTAQPATTVAAATSTTFTIRFDPSAAGARTATITINNDDADEAPYTFAIQGTGEVVAPEIAVEGNGIEISSGDTNPSNIDDTDFGKVDQTTGTLTRSFTIQNTGNGALTLGANAVSLTGSGDFTISTQPPTSIAASGSTTFALTFDPSSLGARTATVSIANNDADEAPYTFAVSGTGVDGGNITLVQNITGPDVTTEFSSPTASLTTSLRTANGTASLLIPNVLPGTHTVTAANLTNLGYGITGISCNDTDSTGDIATATATITLAAGEDVTCTFTAIESREATSTLIADFLGARNTFLLANQPGSGRRIGRFSSVASQTTTGSASGFGLSGAIPVPVQASLTATTLSFASHYAWSGPSGLNAGEASDEDRKAHERGVWIEGQIAGFNDANANGTFGVVYAGADQLITPDILLGALVQYDWFSQDGDTDGSEVTGTGWMAGPYATFKLDEGFFADLRAAWGQSSNDINPTGTYTDRFDTNRWLVSGALIGSYQVDRWTIQPAASLSYIRETQESYTDSLNVVIPEQSVSQGEFRAGPKLSYDIVFESGNRLTPSFNFDGAYTFGNDGLYSSGSLAREVQGLRGRAGFSLDLATTSDLTVSVASHYDGIGTSADLFGATLRFSMLLN